MIRKITETEFLNALLGDRHFAVYARNVGPYANYFARAFWKDKTTLPATFEDAQAKKDKLREIVKEASKKMVLEQSKLGTVRGQMMGIFGKALNGTLGKELSHPSNHMAPGAYQANANDHDAIKAAKWIMYASGSLEHLNCPVTEHDIVVAIRHISTGIPLFSAETVKYIRKKTYFGPKQSNLNWGLAKLKKLRPRLPQRRTDYTHINMDEIGDVHEARYSTFPDSAVRWAAKEHPYPGTISGRYFLYNSVFPKAVTLGCQFAARATTDTDFRWRGATPQDLACFALGSFIATHPFKDGNGRTARVLYAGVLLAHREPFVAPTAGMEQRLHGLTTVEMDTRLPPSRNFDFFNTI
ncbi:Fic family protein [Labrenzia sp. 011]|uniref:Fic family protein n=1 Tax=Labrenzia sp. 011 TaxID=2171494 RepID=UPI000D5079E0|nr:Fic family protein [Labrenzia sp. 011]PVB60827.1 hypothetical protein DCO57_15560 [Labrenzia sp. 011]